MEGCGLEQDYRAVGVGRYGAVAQLGERLNGIQEVDGSTPFSSTAFAEPRCVQHTRQPMTPSRYLLTVIALTVCIALANGCAMRQRYPTTAEAEESIERPA